MDFSFGTRVSDVEDEVFFDVVEPNLFQEAFWLPSSLDHDYQLPQHDPPKHDLQMLPEDFNEPKRVIGNITIKLNTFSDQAGRRFPTKKRKVYRIGGSGLLTSSVQSLTNQHPLRTPEKRKNEQVEIVSAASKKIRVQSKNDKKVKKAKRHLHKARVQNQKQAPICNCNTQCLKGYCVCFTAGLVCSGRCKCQQSKCCNNNRKKNQEIRRLALLNFNLRKKDLDYCCCKKNACKKKYCICLAKGRQCTDKCKCIGCENQS